MTIVYFLEKYFVKFTVEKTNSDLTKVVLIDAWGWREFVHVDKKLNITGNGGSIQEAKVSLMLEYLRKKNHLPIMSYN